MSEGFNLDPSSEEENSDSESEVELEPAKRKKGEKKRATATKGDGYKLTRATKSKDLDDDEENLVKKKPKRTSNTKMAENQKGKSGKAVSSPKKIGGDNTKKKNQSERMIATVMMKMTAMAIRLVLATQRY